MAVEHGRLVPRERLGGHGLRSLHESDVFTLTSTSVNPLRPIINWTGLPCLLPARTAWAQIASKLRNLRSHGTQLRANPN